MFSNGYEIKDYQSKKTFSSFLSGIAGTMGVPIWSFYVNRGQAISSFGSKDKNGAIMEFFPANSSYLHTQRLGFRTFIKVEGIFYEFFSKANKNQTMQIYRDKLVIEEINNDLSIKIKITYFTLSNEKNGGLIRKVQLENFGKKRKIELIDGLAQILSAGIDYGGFKAISNLLQSWMQVDMINNSLFYKLRGTTNDTSQMGTIVDGNFYQTFSKNNEHFKYIYDNKLIFSYDTGLETPYSFIEKDLDVLLKDTQSSVNQIPAAYSAFSIDLEKKLEFITLIGYASDTLFLKHLNQKYNFEYLNGKETENERIHNELVNVIKTETSSSLFDEYMKQNYLDNILRGGMPLIFETKEGIVGYHIYSRKHGDLERDYNFFSIEPKYYSQGNGNFRDVLQNRRNDLYFHPELKDSNLFQFASLIQADGYNPLSIEGLKFNYLGNEKYSERIMNVLSNEFTPGDLAMILELDGINVEDTLTEIIKNSKAIVKANFGEGYWGDHFTYLDDVIDSVENIYPDEIDNIVFGEIKYAIYNSGIYVKPRDLKYVLTNDGKIRQYNALEHVEKRSDWLLDANGEIIKVNLIGKLITLILNKYAHLDPFNIGISYEADKPGWNDAMNGLPGIFSSGISETIELLKIVKRVERYLENNNDKNVYILNDTLKLFEDLSNIKYSESLDFWNNRMNALEKYRKNLLDNKLEVENIKAKNLIDLIKIIRNVLEIGISKAKKIEEIIPTYLSYEVIDYELIDKNSSFIRALSFRQKPIPTFLEAPARLLKTIDNIETSKNIYKNIKNSELYDQKFKFYKTSIDLTNESPEIGRIEAFTKGWLERESNFLHMTYKYLYSILKSGLYEEYYDEIKTNYTCFMDPEIYGRSPIENSSFIAPSNNPDKRKHGQGFVSRLSGSTAEMLSMWSYMFFGPKLFSIDNNELVFTINPKLSKEFFKDKRVSTMLFSTINVEIINEDLIDTFSENARITKVILTDINNVTKEFYGNRVTNEWALKIRQKSIYKIKVIISKEENK